MAVKMSPPPDVRTRRRPPTQYHLHCIAFLFVFAFAKPVVYASCSLGYYGDRCDLRCNCVDHSENCDPDGFCNSGCRAGYTGNGCMEKCSLKTYGVDCAEKCVCGDDCPCDPVTGTCIYAECKHPESFSDASAKKGVWISLALLGLVVFFVAAAILLNCLRNNRVGLIKKLKLDSLEKYRKSKRNSSAPAQSGKYDEVTHKVFIPKRQPDDNPAKHQEGDDRAPEMARDDDCHAPGPVPNTLMQTQQPDPCKDNTHPGDSITENTFKSSKRSNKRNVLYVPKASLVKEKVHPPVYENVDEVKGRRFKAFDSPERADDGRDSPAMLQMDTVFPSQDAVASLSQTKMLPVDHRSSAVKGQRVFTVSAVCRPETNVPADGAEVVHDLRTDGISAEQLSCKQTVGPFPDIQTRREKDNFTGKHLEDDMPLSPDQPRLTKTHKYIQMTTPVSLYDTEAISPTGIRLTNVSPTYSETDELLQQKSMLKQSPNQYANTQDSPSYIKTGKQHTSIPRKYTKYGSPVEQYHIKSNDLTRECSVQEEALKTINPTYRSEKKEFRDMLHSSIQSSVDSLKPENDAVYIQEDDIYESCIDTESSSEALATQKGHWEQPDAEIKSPPQPSPKRRAPFSGAEVTEQTFSASSSSPAISASARSKSSPQQRTIAQKILSPKSFEKSTSHVQQQSGTFPYSPSSPDVSTPLQWSSQTDRLSASLTRGIGNLSGEGLEACLFSGSKTFPRKSGDERVSAIPVANSLTSTTSMPHVVCRLCKPSTNVTVDNHDESTGEQNLPVQTSPVSYKSSQERLKSTDARDPDILKTTRTSAEVATRRAMKDTTPALSPSKDSQQIQLRSNTSSRSLNTLRTTSRSPPQCPSRGPQSPPQRLLHGPHSPQKPTFGLPSCQHCLHGTPSPRQSALDAPSPRHPAHGSSPTRIPVRSGRVGTKGGNCEAFEHTHYHLLGTSVQQTKASQSVPEPASEEPLVVQVSENHTDDSEEPCDQANAQIYMNTSAAENV